MSAAPTSDIPSDSEPASPYRAVSGLAVVSLLSSFLTPLALLRPVFWLMPLVTCVLGVLALRRIRRYEPPLVGRPLAIVALAVGLLFGLGGPARWLSYGWTIRAQAIAVADQWFAHLRQDDPVRAFQPTLTPAERHNLGDDPWEVFRRNPEERRKLRIWMTRPLVRTLLELGPRATARLYRVRDHLRMASGDTVTLVYAISYRDDRDRLRTFFADVMVARRVRPDQGDVTWQILLTRGGMRPEDFPETPQKAER